MTRESNEFTVRTYFQIVDSGDLGQLDGIFAPDYVLHYYGIPEALPIAGAKQILGMIGNAFPRSRHVIRSLESQDNRMTTEIDFYGAHLGDFQGVAPTGRNVAVSTKNAFRLAGGQIAEHWIEVDLGEVMRQIGAAPAATNGTAAKAYRNGHSSVEANKAIVHRIYDEAINQENPAVIGETFAADAVIHDPFTGTAHGAAAFAQLLGMFDAAFPHHRVTVEKMVAEGDYVSVLHTHFATNTGSFMGMPATGRSVVVNGLELFRLVDGRIVEFWRKDDDVSLLMQLGAIPAPAPVPA